MAEFVRIEKVSYLRIFTHNINKRKFMISCCDCSRNGHTQCYCTANTNSKCHYVSNSEGTDQPLVINESCYRNTNQGNGLAPLSR